MKSHDMAYVACFLIGFVMLALGIGGFISLGMIVKDWNPARGVVERIESERVYKYRKMRWEHRVDVRYETVEFGEMYTSKEVYLTFGMREGGEIALLYNPEYEGKAERHESIVDVVKEDNAGHLSRTGSVQLWKNEPRQTASKSPKTRCRKKTVQTE